ncbi:MAG: 5-carboxymethyl-2-hydroxymuconate semialdehyde dehydrogenase [Ardenticatenaceae bacterium]|nr:5-carboxymethyl-2-hydroxymuconate semialdehyde dehydrogenase [Ardenticatenaceae bacterium]
MAATGTLTQNLEKIAAHRADIAQRGVKNIINGEHGDALSGATYENGSPVDSSLICTVAKSDAADIDAAAQAAQAAFPAWAALPVKKRRDLLYNVADLIEANAEKIALLESLDTGQPIRFMSAAAVRSAENFRFFADRVESAQDGLSLPTHEHLNYTIRQPIGPVGIITPWNTPFMLSTWKIAPALAAGCTVVHKPAELSPVTAQILAELVLEAGIAPGVLNLVNGYGETAGKALTEHPAIKAIGFVGESITGSRIMAQGAATLKRVHFELGGKNPVIVFADADFERALDAAIFMIYSLNGERCTSSSRLLVERPIYAEFTTRLAERVQKIKVGHPLDPQTEIGPLIHQEHWDKVSGYVAIGQEDGATLMVGDGKRPSHLEHDLADGTYINPILFIDATPDMRIAQEEVFGPFLTAIPFEGEDEALTIANNVKYGLTAYIWTQDVGRALRMAHNVEAGMVWVNSHNVRHLPTPFGGVKASGIGRDGGDYSFDFYMETKNISLAMGNHRIPKLGN